MNDDWASVRAYLLRFGEGSEKKHPRVNSEVCKLCMEKSWFTVSHMQEKGCSLLHDTFCGSSWGTGVFLGFSWLKLEHTSSPVGKACPLIVINTETLEDENNLCSLHSQQGVV